MKRMERNIFQFCLPGAISELEKTKSNSISWKAGYNVPAASLKLTATAELSSTNTLHLNPVSSSGPAEHTAQIFCLLIYQHPHSYMLHWLHYHCWHDYIA